MGMRALVIAAGLLALGTGAAAADTIDNLKGNTLLVTRPDGHVSAYHVMENGRAHLEQSEGLAAEGSWRLDPDRPGAICLTMRGQATACIPLSQEKRVGDEWGVVGPGGQVTFVLRIAEGQAGPDAAANPHAGHGEHGDLAGHEGH
jgi:hypothetical protein